MSTPLRCTSCGEDLIVRCPNGHDTLDEAIAAQMTPDAVARSRRPHGKERTRKSHYAYRDKPCRRCSKAFTPSGPRSLYCPECAA